MMNVIEKVQEAVADRPSPPKELWATITSDDGFFWKAFTTRDAAEGSAEDSRTPGAFRDGIHLLVAGPYTRRFRTKQIAELIVSAQELVEPTTLRGNARCRVCSEDVDACRCSIHLVRRAMRALESALPDNAEPDGPIDLPTLRKVAEPTLEHPIPDAVTRETPSLKQAFSEMRKVLSDYRELHVLRQKASGQREHLANLDNERARMAKWILEHLPESYRDHACAQCVPTGPMIVKGFVCVVHRAHSILGHATQLEASA